jgi:hypothetical protein
MGIYLSDGIIIFSGSRQALLGAGLTPDDLEWPAGRERVRWEDGGFSYWLERARPAGHKGPMRSVLELDHWELRSFYKGNGEDWAARRNLQRGEDELAARRYLLTPEGMAERHAKWVKWAAARGDKAFRSFLDGVLPERKKSGRKPKAEGSAA